MIDIFLPLLYYIASHKNLSIEFCTPPAAQSDKKRERLGRLSQKAFRHSINVFSSLLNMVYLY
ncbi:MAG: hypothetical protein AYK19_21085 [Theionarchaea archaeon DG-70-1]|nr:MAG: hypothetical protein AYK19_21085 [Theionarchaea archaeon DG-70-1]